MIKIPNRIHIQKYRRIKCPCSQEYINRINCYYCEFNTKEQNENYITCKYSCELETMDYEDPMEYIISEYEKFWINICKELKIHQHFIRNFMSYCDFQVRKRGNIF